MQQSAREDNMFFLVLVLPRRKDYYQAYIFWYTWLIMVFAEIIDLKWASSSSWRGQGGSPQHGQEGCHSCFWFQLPHGPGKRKLWQGNVWASSDTKYGDLITIPISSCFSSSILPTHDSPATYPLGDVWEPIIGTDYYCWCTNLSLCMINWRAGENGYWWLKCYEPAE